MTTNDRSDALVADAGAQAFRGLLVHGRPLRRFQSSGISTWA
jgi:hypothetical protein